MLFTKKKTNHESIRKTQTPLTIFLMLTSVLTKTKADIKWGHCNNLHYCLTAFSSLHRGVDEHMAHVVSHIYSCLFKYFSTDSCWVVLQDTWYKTINTFNTHINNFYIMSPFAKCTSKFLSEIPWHNYFPCTSINSPFYVKL